MATKTFKVLDVDGNGLKFQLNNDTVSVSTSGGNQTKYLANEGYRFDYTDADTAVKFSTEIGGEYVFDGDKKTSVAAFDASGAKDLIKLNATGLTGLTKIKTGAGNDSIVAVNDQSIIKTGEGNDIVTFNSTGNSASVTLGDGKDTLEVTAGTVEVKDYSFAEGDEISIGNIGFSDHANNINVAADGKFSVGSAAGTSVTGSLKSEGNVAEMKINGNHYAFATGNVSDYVAKDKVLFQVAATDVDVLNFTSGKKDTSVLATGLAKDATLNFVSDHGNDSVAVVDTTKINYAITKNSGDDTFAGKTFTTDDTLMIKDGVAASLKMSGAVLTYGNTSVTGVLDSVGGSFKVQNAGSDESYLMSYVDNSKTATFSTDAKFYLADEKSNAIVDASNLTDANINMNGDAVTYAAFSDGFNNIKTAQSGYVVGRNNVATSIDASAGVGRLDIYGGAKGNDSINLTNNNSTDVIYYSLGDGNDTVNGFDATSDVVFFYNANANYKALADVVKFDTAGAATVTFDKKSNVLTLNGVKANDTLVFADQNMAEAMKVAIGDGNDVEFATDTKVYTNAATLKVNTGNTGDVLAINLTAQSDEYGYYSTDIVNIDAAGSNATTYLVGANKAGAKVTGGTGTNYIYGGGNKNQELVGNAAAVDVIYFGTGDGKDNVTSISADDGVLLYNVADINSVKVTADSSQTVVSLGSDKLTLNGLTETDLATFTFADQSGALYNYNTTDKKFVKKA